ncbi:MBL fold metallo-hydrolase [candidate division KSB1 bacterium]|nr:MBL fold metallo-hydrolase [candidate division KSB1 bacterium]
MRTILLILISALALYAGAPFSSDTLQTGGGPLIMTFIGHGTLLFDYNGFIIHIDPVQRYADYNKLPKADLILVTHEHGDHLDPQAISKIRQTQTIIITNEASGRGLKDAVVLKNGASKKIKDILIIAVPAYNILHKRKNGEPFHPRGVGNGYVLHLADKRIYIAGDTENIPEMADLENIDVAFLPMNLPYTMSPEMTAEAAKMIRPAILYPYHYSRTDPMELVELLKDEKAITVRIRDLQ